MAGAAPPARHVARRRANFGGTHVKLRLLDDSIRLRLSRTEVDTAADKGVVEGHTRFPDGAAFVFALESAPGADIGSTYSGNRLVVRVPASEISAWAHDDEAVSLQGELALPDGNRLKLLVEKDFRCVTPRGDEDQSDMYPNPDVSC